MWYVDVCVTFLFWWACFSFKFSILLRCVCFLLLFFVFVCITQLCAGRAQKLKNFKLSLVWKIVCRHKMNCGKQMKSCLSNFLFILSLLHRLLSHLRSSSSCLSIRHTFDSRFEKCIRNAFAIFVDRLPFSTSNQPSFCLSPPLVFPLCLQATLMPWGAAH